MSPSRPSARPRRFPGPVFLLALAGGFAWPAASAWSQAAPKKDASKAAAKQAEPEPVDDVAARPGTGPEVFRDPKAKALMENSFEQLFRNEAVTPQQRDQVRQAAGGAALGPPLIQVLQRYVRAQAKELTDHKNIEALLSPGGNPNDFKALEEAATSLAVPLDVANGKKNANFRREFVKAMLAQGVGDAILKNHLYARIQFLVALSASADPQAIDTFVALLGDANQPDAVKQLAAVGMARLVGNGARAEALETSQRLRCSKALSDFLRREPRAMRPALVKAIMALGAMRQDSADPQRDDLEFLQTIMAYLASPDQPPEVRAMAAWAVGMLRITPNAPVNFPLIVHHMGLVGVELTERAMADYDPSAVDSALNEPARYWVSRLVAWVYYGLKGDSEVPESGLMPLATRVVRGDELKVVTSVDERLRAVGQAAVAMTRAAGSFKAQEKRTLGEKLADLRGFLARNPPKSFSLVPNGPEFRPAGDPADTAAAPAKADAR